MEAGAAYSDKISKLKRYSKDQDDKGLADLEGQLKQIIGPVDGKGFLRLLTIGCLLLLRPALASDESKSWEGKYTFEFQEKHEGTWSGTLEIQNCQGDGCEFDYSAGTESSLCSARGRMTIRGKRSAEYVEATHRDGEGPGTCTLQFHKKGAATINVDSHDSGRDEHACNALCGWQGARYFGFDFKRSRSARRTLSSENPRH